MSTTARERVELLATQLNALAREHRDAAEEARMAELSAFNDDDEPGGDEAQALYYVERGKALAYEDAALKVKLLAAGIAEDTGEPSRTGSL